MGPVYMIQSTSSAMGSNIAGQLRPQVYLISLVEGGSGNRSKDIFRLLPAIDSSKIATWLPRKTPPGGCARSGELRWSSHTILE